MKYCIVIGDGMSDHPLPQLGGKTPLQAAGTPVMDALAARGTVGTVLTIPEGEPAGSDTAILSICGFDPRVYYSGRAPLEAAGTGVSLRAGDTAYRCNMIALEDGPEYSRKRILSHSGGAVDGQTAMCLMADLLADPQFAACSAKHGVEITPTPSFRHIAIQHGADTRGLTTMPPHDHLGEPAGALLPAGSEAAGGLRELMRLAHDFLDRHPLNETRRAEGRLPANSLWFWAQGAAASLPSIKETRGMSGFVVSAVPLVWGIGALAGLDRILVPGATAELDTNYEGKADAAVKGLSDGYDLALLHVEAPDECTHMGDLEGKLEAIRRLDARCLARLKAGLDASGEDYRLLVLSDHKTLMETRGHNGEPVPFLLYDSREDTRGCSAYDEASCEKGPYIGEGHTLLDLLFT
jgi:2,3-bisphosphoglycerate-independent phosphoglycerate mutase